MSRMDWVLMAPKMLAAPSGQFPVEKNLICIHKYRFYN